MAQVPDPFRNGRTRAAAIAGAMLVCACTATTQLVNRIDESSGIPGNRSSGTDTAVQSLEDLPSPATSDDAFAWGSPLARIRKASTRSTPIHPFRKALHQPEMQPVPPHEQPVAEAAPPAAEDSSEPAYDGGGMGASAGEIVASALSATVPEAPAGDEVVAIRPAAYALWRRQLDRVIYAGVVWKNRVDQQLLALDRRWVWAVLSVSLVGVAWLARRIRKRRNRWFFDDLSA